MNRLTSSTATRTYLVLGNQRSGTTLYCGYLEDTGLAGRPVREPFTAEHEGVGFRPGAVTFTERVRQLRATCTANGVLGFNIMWNQLDDALAKMRRAPGCADISSDLQLLELTFPGLSRYILIMRRDVVRQAVSWAKAIKLGQWTSRHPARQTVAQYDFDLIDVLLSNVVSYNKAWETWLRAYGIEPLRVAYEDLVAAPARVIKRTFEYLGLDLPPGYRPCQRFECQSDAVNDDWRQRYLSDLETQGRIRPEDYLVG